MLYGAIKHCIFSESLVNCQNAMGDTPLHLAAYRGHYEICRRLLQAGASANLVNHKNKTAIDEADNVKHHKIVKLLKEGKRLHFYTFLIRVVFDSGS